jgi:hypothetical protein
VNVPTGGRKKKLKQRTATIDAVVDSTMPHAVAINRIATRYESATVVGLTRSAWEYSTVMSATAPIDAAMRPIARRLRTAL